MVERAHPERPERREPDGASEAEHHTTAAERVNAATEAVRAGFRARLSRWDRTWIVWVARWRRRPITALMRAATKLGDPVSITLITILIACFGRAWWPTALAFGASAAGGGVSAQLIKRLFGRRRPNVRIEGFVSIAGNPDKFSFPSGHTATAFAVAASMIGHPGGLGLVTVPLAVLIAISRVYLGAHYPFDVAAGVLVGGIVGTIVRTIVF